MRRSRTARTIVVSALLAVSAVLLAACTTPADAKPDDRPQVKAPFAADLSGRLNTALADAMTLSGSSGAIAGVWAPWAGEWVASPGSTTRGGSTPLTTDMRFRIADNTRSMTCTVLLKLVDAGTVKLGDPVTKYLTRLSGVEGITLGQLCQNTSGLPDYTASLGQHFVNNPTRPWAPLEVLSSGLASPRVGAPGEKFAESNTGFVLLGLALQAATDKDWPTLYRQYIFDPLGMSNSSFPGADDVGIPGPHPAGYAPAQNPAGQSVCETVLDESKLSPSMSWVAGGVVSNVTDMKVWARALAEGRLVSKKSEQAQWATVPLGPDQPAWRGYGLGAEQLGPLRGDSGAIPGYLSAAFADPASGLTVVVMLNNSNAGSGFVQALAQRLASIAAKAPPAQGEKAPTLELPWSEEQATAAMTATPVCPPPAPTAAPAG